MIMTQPDFAKILSQGIMLESSGSTGPAKSLFQSPEKLRQANHAARQSQQISAQSRVLTCCRMTHAGGLLAQSLPAWEVGAAVDIMAFNAYAWVRTIKDYTHTHLTPKHCQAIMLTHGFQDLDLSGTWVTIGADPVSWDILRAFLARGARVMTNWGMTEVGPTAINTVFDDLQQVEALAASAPPHSSYLGQRAWCDVDLRQGLLWVRGDISIYGDRWFCTGDRVSQDQQGHFWYHGRQGRPQEELWQSRKG